MTTTDLKKTSAKVPQARTFWLWHAGLPLVLLLAGTLFFRLTSYDLDWEKGFYDAGAGNWTYARHTPWKELYDYGEATVFLICGSGLVLVLCGAFIKKMRPALRVGAYLIAATAIGPGLITNELLKEYWGRPRPRDVQDVGGRYAFEPVLVYDASSPGKSFPSGHASAAFSVMILYFVALHQRWPHWTRWAFLVSGLIFGILMGIARMVQGGHFASDVLWAAGVVWFTACFCAWGILHLPKEQ